MWAQVDNNSVVKVFTRPQAFSIGDNNYPANTLSIWSEADLNALDISEVVEDNTNEKGELNIGIYVTLAESFAVAKQDKEYFLELINKALSMDVNADKEMKQANLLSKLRGKWLLTRIDDLFYM